MLQVWVTILDYCQYSVCIIQVYKSVVWLKLYFDMKKLARRRPRERKVEGRHDRAREKAMSCENAIFLILKSGRSEAEV